MWSAELVCVSLDWQWWVKANEWLASWIRWLRRMGEGRDWILWTLRKEGTERRPNNRLLSSFIFTDCTQYRPVLAFGDRTPLFCLVCAFYLQITNLFPEPYTKVVTDAVALPSSWSHRLWWAMRLLGTPVSPVEDVDWDSFRSPHSVEQQHWGGVEW